EGGYDIPSLADAIVVHVDALDRGYECCNDAGLDLDETRAKAAESAQKLFALL
ncbi:MAG: hypothetical protein RL688_1376, partial [Actinomycetota bacterium]